MHDALVFGAGKIGAPISGLLAESGCTNRTSAELVARGATWHQRVNYGD